MANGTICWLVLISTIVWLHSILFLNNLFRYDACLTLVAHYGDVIMGAIAYKITSLTVVYSTVYSDADQRKHQSSASLVFVTGIHRGPVNSPHKWPVTRKVFPFDDVIMLFDCGIALIKVFSLYGMYQRVYITMTLLIMCSVILLIYLVHFLNKRFPNLNLTILSRTIFENYMWYDPKNV